MLLGLSQQQKRGKLEKEMNLTIFTNIKRKVFSRSRIASDNKEHFVNEESYKLIQIQIYLKVQPVLKSVKNIVKIVLFGFGSCSLVNTT